jgi:hypothetical protein
MRRHTQEDVLAETKDEFRGKSLDGVSADETGEFHARGLLSRASTIRCT